MPAHFNKQAPVLYLGGAPRSVFFSFLPNTTSIMLTRYWWMLALAGSLWACEQAPTEAPTTATEQPAPQTPPTTPAPDPAPPYVAQLETAHHKAEFLAKEAVQFDIVLTFGGKERLNGTITALTNSTQARIDYADGRRVLYKDNTVYAPAAMAEPDKQKSTRFGAYTWPYFFLFPYKLNDPGTQWAPYTNNVLQGKTYEAQKLTFEAGTGDDPGDWYITYADPASHLVEVAAYIVTAGKTQAEAEEDPHAVQYSDYKLVDGIPIAHQWTFWAWRTEAGLTDQLGAATISNVRFIQPDATTFAVPEGHATL